MILDIDAVKRRATAQLDQSRRGEFGQYMTPSKVAKFMASFFESTDGSVHLLEAGAGVGSLVTAFLDRLQIGQDVNVTAYEIDPVLLPHLTRTLNTYTDHIRTEGGQIKTCILADDFIQEGSKLIAAGVRPFTHAILNPPYKKIHSQSAHRQQLRSIGQEHVNLYTAFISLALAQLRPGGQLVAIVPRSFCNGLYYKSFRRYILGRAAIKRLHLFESRTAAFVEDEVLQENIIIYLVRGGEQGTVIVSQSSDPSLCDMQQRSFPFNQIIREGDEEGFIYVPHIEQSYCLSESELISSSLKEIGLEVSTGPVVDFRVKEHLRQQLEAGAVPLFYPAHFNGKELDWPYQGKKPNAIDINPQTINSLWPSGYYTVVRRFSSKEEKQRIVARVINPKIVTAEMIGIENHLNVFHHNKAGLDADIAYGLAAFLNSSFVDRYFRSFSGHTQVNATDLKRLRYPSREHLVKLGQEAKGLKSFSPGQVDLIVSNYI